MAAETDLEREARHLTEDLTQSIPPIYHALVRILIDKAVITERHRCARAMLDFAATLSRSEPPRGQDR